MFSSQNRPDHPDVVKLDNLHRAVTDQLPNHQIRPDNTIDTSAFSNWIREHLQIDPDSLHFFTLDFAMKQHNIEDSTDLKPHEMLMFALDPAFAKSVSAYGAAMSLGFTLGHEWARMRDMEQIGAE